MTAEIEFDIGSYKKSIEDSIGYPMDFA